MHPRDGLGDVVILTMALFPARGELDSLQLGMVGSTPTMARHVREAGDDPHTFHVGPVQIEIVEAVPLVRLQVEDGIEVPVAMDLTFTARTPPYGLRRGTMRAGHELIWDQSHMFQSGTYRRHLHPRGADAPGRRLVGPARPLVGHPRPRPLPVLDVAGGAAARRDDRRVAVGAGQRRADLHRRLLRAGRRRRPDPDRRRPAPAGVDRPHGGGAVSYARDGDEVAGIAGHVDSGWRAVGRSGSTRPAAGPSATARSAVASTRSRSPPTTAAGAPASTS